MFGSSSKLTPEVTFPNNSQVKPTKKVSKSHPIFSLFNARRKKKTTARPEFARYLEYVKEGGLWDMNLNKPVIYYKWKSTTKGRLCIFNRLIRIGYMYYFLWLCSTNIVYYFTCYYSCNISSSYLGISVIKVIIQKQKFGWSKMDIFSFVNLMLFILYKSFGLVLIIELAASLKHFKNNYVCKRTKAKSFKRTR